MTFCFKLGDKLWVDSYSWILWWKSRRHVFNLGARSGFC